MAVGDFVLGFIAICHDEDLCQGCSAGSFALAPGDSARSVEGIEEMGAEILVGQIDGSSGAGHAIEFGFGTGRLIHRVQKHFCDHPSPIVTSEILPVLFVTVRGFAAELVDGAIEHQAAHVLHVKSMIDEVLCECIEELRVGGWIGGSHVINFVDESAAEEMPPQTIHQGFGKEWVFGTSHPIDETVTRVLFGRKHGYVPAQVFRLGNLPCSRILFPGGGCCGCEIRRWLSEALATQACEEARKSVVVVLTPSFVGMVVASRALKSLAEEHLGGVCGHLMQLVIAALPIPVDGRSVLPFAAGGDDSTHKLVIGTVA